MSAKNNENINTETNYNKENINNSVDTISSEPASSNPTLSENEYRGNELERLKGDAIGETLYSERFVLNTLLKLGQLSKDLQEDEDVERDLCSLWDMTLEEDVVKYLLNHDILELFANIIANTNDKRLTEILVGILGNMCNVPKTRSLLTEKEEVLVILLDLTSCMDSLTLEQLMRLFTVVFVKMSEDEIEKWYTIILKSESFIENLCFILNNAVNNSLILLTLESLNAILAKFFILKLSVATENNGKNLNKNSEISFEELFVRRELVMSTIEAFETLVKRSSDHKDCYEAAEIPEMVHKAKQIFCNIHSILTQYQELSRDAYESNNSKILKCFKDILKPMTVSSITTWQQYEQDVLETLNDILRVLPKPIDFDILNQLLKLFYKIDKDQETQLKKTSHNNDFESDDDDNFIDHQISHALILNTLYYIIYKSDKKELKQYVRTCSGKYTDVLVKSFKEPYETEYIKNCHLKLKEILDE